jgi:general L-amino acid transport system substrate-binding protein
MSWRSIALSLALASAACCGVAHAGTLKTVRDRGVVKCGVSNNVPGFAVFEDNEWKGFDVDFCRAIAAAIFSDPTKVQVIPVPLNDRFETLRSKKVDVIASDATWTLSREGDNKIAFTGITYFDEQAFMTPKAVKAKPLKEALRGSKVCLEEGSTSELNFLEYAKDNNIEFQPVKKPQFLALVQAYEAGDCNVLTSDRSQLYGQKKNLAKPGDHEIREDAISQEPLGPAVRQDDPEWFNIIRWVNFALINAEALNLSQANIDAAKDSNKEQNVQRFVGAQGDFGRYLGLSPLWAYNIVKYVGNYGEVLERNLGEKSMLGIKRVLNKLLKDGGIQYAPPIR